MSDEPYRPRLDTLTGCGEELSRCNREIAEMAPGWARASGELAGLEATQKRMFREAMRTTKGSNAQEREALAHAACEEAYRSIFKLTEGEPGLGERIEQLIGEVESCKVSFKTLDRRSSNVQSILQLRRQEAGLGRFVQDG